MVHHDDDDDDDGDYHDHDYEEEDFGPCSGKVVKSDMLLFSFFRMNICDTSYNKGRHTF